MPHVDHTGEILDQIVRLTRLAHHMKKSASDDGRSAHMLLFPLRACGPLRVSALAEMTHSDPSTISRHTADLVRDRLLRRETDPADRRASLLAITDEGRQVCEDLRQQRRALLARVMDDWSDAEVATFAALFRRFNDGTARYALDGSLDGATAGLPPGLAPATPTPATENR